VSAIKTHAGFLELQRISGRLRIVLTPNGRQELQRRLDNGDNIDAEATLYDLLEDHLCNGWEWILPEELGALTSAPILSDDCRRDDQGRLIEVRPVFWFPSYQILSPVNQLLNAGHVDFDRAG
jgi:hypothetical protein